VRAVSAGSGCAGERRGPDGLQSSGGGRESRPRGVREGAAGARRRPKLKVGLQPRTEPHQVSHQGLHGRKIQRRQGKHPNRKF